MSHTIETHADTGTERRQHHQLRTVFVSCCDFLTPLVVGNEKTKTVSSFAMARMLGDRFPMLSSAEIHIVILTVERMNQHPHLHAMPDKGS